MSSEIKTILLGALAGGVVSGVVGVGTFLYTDSVSQTRSAQIQTILSFSDRGFPLADLSAKYIAAVADQKPVDDIRLLMRGAIAQEIMTTENLRPVLANADESIDNYQRALKEFSATLNGADSPVHMRPWVEAFGKTVDARRALDKKLRSGIGV